MKILDESYYDDLLRDLEEIFREQQKDVISVICDRLRAVGKLNPTSAKQLARMAKYQNADLKEIEKVIKKTSRMAEKEIDTIFKQAAESSREYAEVLAHTAIGGSYEANLQMLVSTAARECKDMVLNLSDTYAFKTDGKVLNIRQQYIKSVNKAVSAVSTGTFDYNTAIRQTVKQMVDSGLRTRQSTGEKVLEWESGYTRRVDSSVRMNVLEGVRRMNQAILDDAAEKYATGYEISAHDRPAPDHADIQGRQYTRADFENLNASLARPIGTLNCMHIAYPIIYGVTKPTYTDEQLANMKRNAEKEYTWKGKKLTGYECTQMQRKYETAIRRAKEQEAAFKAAGNDLDAKRARRNARHLTEEYREFSDHVGLSVKENRTKNITKGLDNNAGTGIINTRKSTNMKITQSGEVVNPMPKEEYNKIKTALGQQGVEVFAAVTGDDLRYLLTIGAEGTYSNNRISHVGEVPSRGTFYEEIIHMAQARKYGELESTDSIELCAREIAANRKLLEHQSTYKLDAFDVDDVRRNLSYWEQSFQKLKGVSYDESDYWRDVSDIGRPNADS